MRITGVSFVSLRLITLIFGWYGWFLSLTVILVSPLIGGNMDGYAVILAYAVKNSRIGEETLDSGR